MNFNELNAYIDSVVTANGQEEITGSNMNLLLKAMVGELGDGYSFKGAATPATNPGTPDNHVWFLATEAGTYTNFGGAVVTEPTILYFDTAWHAQAVNGDFADVIRTTNIVDNLNSNSSDDVLSAKQGHVLKNAVDAKYTKPGSGIPKSDLDASVQATLDLADTAVQDVSGKADKVNNATSGDFAGLDTQGNLTDSGKKASDFATASQGAKADTAYQKPLGGIPSTDMTSSVQESLAKADTAYQKPNSGIPSTDMTAAVRSSLEKADTAIQDVSGKQDTLVSGENIKTLNGESLLGSGNITVATDISGKADKVSGATNGDFAGLDANGNLTDSGKKASDFQDALVSGTNIKTINNESLLGSGNITIEGADISGKADKVSGATSGDFAGLDGNGNLTDSGKKASDFATAAQGAKADTAIQDVSDKADKVEDAVNGNLAGLDANGNLKDSGIAADNVAQKNGYYAGMAVGLADNLRSWENEDTPVTNSWTQTIRTTAGDDPINTDDGGVFKGMNAGNGEDFMCEAIASTGYNQLRLVADGGQAKSLSSDAARVIPVPHLKLGNFGTVEENNGMLFTGKPSGYTSGFAFGGSDLQPTVRFVPLSDGEPTSTSNGEAVTPTAVTYQDETYHTYLTSGEGWLIVTPPSGVAWSDICAHIAWEDWYDRFVSPTDAADNSGDSIDLTPIATALTNGLNGTGKLLYLAEGIFTKVERTSETTVLITDPVARLTSPEWTDTLQEDGETYLHTLTISGMKQGGAARIEGSSQYLTIVGNTLSYADQNATAISGAVRYERATTATATATLAKTSYSLNDCGIEIKVGATGTGYVECEYVQNVSDAVRMLASVKIVSLMQVIAEALVSLKAENDGLKAIINDPTRRINALEYRSCGFPMMLSAAGTPNASVVPNEWTDEMGVWAGVPMAPGQEYFDTQNNKWYKAKMPISGAISDWLLLN